MADLLANSLRGLWSALDRSRDDQEDGGFQTHFAVLIEILDSLPDYIWICDANLRETMYISLACERLLGVPRQDLLGDCRKLLKRVHEADRHNVLKARRLAIMGEYEQTYRIVRPDGEVRWIQDRGFMLPDRSGVPGYIAGIAVDVTERRASEQQLLELAYHDSLTKLPNRMLFYDRLAQTVAHARRNGWTLAVVFIDVDHFKRVNDTAGHLAGDELLKQIAPRLSACVRAEDTVARLSGDEFGIILSNVATGAHAALVAEKVMQSLSATFQVQEREFCMSASLGIALYPADSSDPEALVRNADAAMYVAKKAGRNTYRFYSTTTV